VSGLSADMEWSDSDLTTDDEDEDEWEGLPIADV
jgi:phosphatidylinositol-3,4,5-trisphosphate 3-phosphatase/dual-specificity protein phosphatase PTEN